MAGCTASPTQLRMPLANTRPSLPSGVNTSTSARFSSGPQVTPRPRLASSARLSATGRRGISSATLEPEPTDTNIRLPSGLKRMSRVEWPPPDWAMAAITVRGRPWAAVSPLR